MKTKGAQFWILLLSSIVISVLLVSQIFITRAIAHQQRFLADQRQTAEAGPYYREAWHNLAVEVWKASAQDPALLDMLKSEGIGVHQGSPPAIPAAGSPAPAASAAPTDSVTPPSKPDAVARPGNP